MSKAWDDVLAERRRQVEVEGFSVELDKGRGPQLALAAAAYALSACEGSKSIRLRGVAKLVRRVWPWAPHVLKRKTSREDLVRSAALALAAVEQIDLCPAQGQGEP